ncbi:ribosome recycling factor domain-containing protein [Boeremia exigua]|uniref:ribosome recycling factor domain-containing protein n=1 Tax=Boeremia exigua TaxID=749465 RepID=UPI001E8ED1F5|nr:ribosome recycling factor domain-containing protein [Boeremia exigua]KAH6633037.1 ribosome recycling factor domain-containing protein [Boeremia exigua]
MSQSIAPRVALRLSSRSLLGVSTRAIESPCHNLCAFHASTTLCGPKLRNFSKYPPLLKKAGKANKSHAKTDSSPPVNQAGGPTATDEIYDMSELESSILKAIEKLTHDLAQLRSGGRLNPDIVESLKVQLGTTAQGKEAVRLGDIAQVVPRGRVLNVICGDDAHIKPITTAIAASPHSLTPLAPDQNNPLTIQVPLPPPTGDTRREAIESARKAAEKADAMVQRARQDHNKLVRKYDLNKEVRPDDIQKAKKRMEEVVKRGHDEVKRIADGAKRVLDSQ